MNRSCESLAAPRSPLNRFAVIIAGMMAGLVGCKATISEVRGKTSFGPEFRNRGNNTSEIRYDARQGIEIKWDNGWTTGVTQRYREIDNGAGDQEFLTLLEVGYPIWKPAKKPDKAEQSSQRVEEMEHELAALRATVAEMRTEPSKERRLAKTGVEGSSSPDERETHDAKP